ncbi:MAG: 5'/3'-nucleotidase SurE [Candidatus Krumholzibacteriia bacterium]
MNPGGSGQKLKHVLISNDDGIDAHGLQVLEETIRGMEGFRVTVVAPSDQQSASSHSLTLTSPLRIIERGPGRFAVTGTPTDTVLVAIEKILRSDPPDIVLSGINHGPNMGEDVIYSGTVAAAMEGTMCGLPSYAFSLAAWHPTDFSGAAAFIRRYLPRILEFPLRKGSLINVNIPDGPPENILGVRVTRLGSRVYQNVITDQVDPHGRPYFWIGGKGPTWERETGTDYCSCEEGYVSITPLLVDLTHYGLQQEMKHLERDGLPDE